MGQTELNEHTPKGNAKLDDFAEKCRAKRDNLDEVRNIEGFPIGEDEDIHRLSEHPYYTAYPNPHIKEFIEKFGKPYNELTDDYHREPYIGDISEGKNDAIYNAVSFHTKVPHKAIVKFIQHYTEPDDIVFDGFCGTGMTGIAAQHLGRRAILVDLCPSATFITSALNLLVNTKEFQSVASQILKDIESEYGWIYEAVHNATKRGRINFVVWSDIFICPYCKHEIVYWEVAVNRKTGEIKKSIECVLCGAELSRRELEKALINEHPKTTPVLVNYDLDGKKYERPPNQTDLDLIRSIDMLENPYWHPSYPMMFVGERWGDTWRAGVHMGIKTVSDFYSKRNTLILSAVYSKIRKINDREINRYLLLMFTSQLLNVSKLNRFRRVSFPYNPLSGTLYISSTVSEANVLTAYKNKIKKLVRAKQASHLTQGSCIVSTQSATDLSNIPDNSIDYIFTDPPFGDNLMYSELNFLLESWLNVFTNTKPEAIINASQEKGLPEYHGLILACFTEFYRILKPNRWITVEFHNSRASVWNAIQESLSKAGFVVAQVAILDKKQGTFKQITAAGAVKNDLIINAYKPKEEFSSRFLKNAGVDLEREFVEQHLRRLPIEPNIERTDKMLYSKMLSYYVQHGYEITMNAQQFYAMLRNSLEERDGYWFLDSQVDAYESRKKKISLELTQATLFISDEKSAIQWLYWFLSRPKEYTDIYPEFVKTLVAPEESIQELKELLEENFVSENGKYRRSKVGEKEQIDERREKKLLKEFNNNLEKAVAGKKIEAPRKEAILAGFTLCYREKRFHDIITVAKKLPVQIMESSIEIFDLVEVAKTKLSE